MIYEDLIKATGGFGRYQFLIFIFMFIASMYDGLHIACMVFIVPNLKYRCAIPELTNDSYEVQNEAHANLIKEYIPEDIVDNKVVYNKCYHYTNKTGLGNQTLTKCTSWVYDKSVFETTLTSDFDLVCDDEWLGQQVYAVFFIGYLFAMLTFGWLSDRFGRKIVIVSGLILQGAAGILSCQVMNIKAIIVFRLLTAIGGAGSFVPSVVLGSEISVGKGRTITSVFFQITFALGYLVVNLMAYFIRSWKLLVLLASLPSIPSGLIYYWAIPESPRWLLITGKRKQAETILNKMAKMNKKDFICKASEIETSSISDRTVRLWKIFTIPKLFKITIIMTFNWMVVTLVYYCLTLNTTDLSGDIYLNFFFMSIVEIPSHFGDMFLLNFMGRKTLYIASMFLSGFFAIIAIFPIMYASNDLQWITNTLAILSKLCISGTYGIIYVHTCELFPTCVRNGALGFHSTVARIGGVIVPYITMMRLLAEGKLGESLPILTVGLICIVAGISYKFLPETRNRRLDDTFDDIFKDDHTTISENGEYKSETDIPLKNTV